MASYCHPDLVLVEHHPHPCSILFLQYPPPCQMLHHSLLALCYRCLEEWHLISLSPLYNAHFIIVTSGTHQPCPLHLFMSMAAILHLTSLFLCGCSFPNCPITLSFPTLPSVWVLDLFFFSVFFFYLFVYTLSNGFGAT